MQSYFMADDDCTCGFLHNDIDFGVTNGLALLYMYSLHQDVLFTCKITFMADVTDVIIARMFFCIMT